MGVVAEKTADRGTQGNMETAKRPCFLVLFLSYFETRSVVAGDDLELVIFMLKSFPQVQIQGSLPIGSASISVGLGDAFAVAGPTPAFVAPQC